MAMRKTISMKISMKMAMANSMRKNK